MVKVVAPDHRVLNSRKVEEVEQGGRLVGEEVMGGCRYLRLASQRIPGMVVVE